MLKFYSYAEIAILGNPAWTVKKIALYYGNNK